MSMITKKMRSNLPAGVGKIGNGERMSQTGTTFRLNFDRRVCDSELSSPIEEPFEVRFFFHFSLSLRLTVLAKTGGVSAETF